MMAGPIPREQWTAPIQAQTSPPTLAFSPELITRLKFFAHILENAFTIPGTRIRFGLDALIGLIPGFGDAIGALISGYTLWLASRYGVSRTVLLRMMFNLGTDAVLGAIPFVGDLFDVVWKANTRNMAILETAIVDPRAAHRSSTLWLVSLCLIVGVVFIGGLVLSLWLTNWLFQMLFR